MDKSNLTSEETIGTHLAELSQLIQQIDQNNPNNHYIEEQFPQQRKQKLAPKWSVEEDNALQLIVSQQGPKRWRAIAQQIAGITGLTERQPDAVSQRWSRVINPDICKDRWTFEEDKQLINSVQQCGPKQWKDVAEKLPGRTDIQVRYRLQKLKPQLLSQQVLSEDFLP